MIRRPPTSSPFPYPPLFRSTNAGFESGSSSWYLAPQASIDTAPADAHTGNGSLQLVASWAGHRTKQTDAVTAEAVFCLERRRRASPAGGSLTASRVTPTAET